MPDLQTSPLLRRRGLLAAAGALGLGAALAACGKSDGDKGSAKSRSTDAEGGGSGTTGPWSFTDDRGVRVKADSTPRSIVAFVGTAAALHDYGIAVKGVFGPTVTKD